MYLFFLKPGSHVFVVVASTLIMIPQAIYNSGILPVYDCILREK